MYHGVRNAIVVICGVRLFFRSTASIGTERAQRKKDVQKNFSGYEETIDERPEKERKSDIQEVAHGSGPYAYGKARSYLIAKNVGDGAGQGDFVENDTA